MALRLSRSRPILVSVEDYRIVQASEWRIARSEDGRVYAVSRGRARRYLHRLIKPPPPGRVVDHRNGDGLDNRRENLRFLTVGENFKNRPVTRRNRSGYKGVFGSAGRWRAQIRADYEVHCLGTYRSKKQAALAYDAAARHLHGPLARLNFPRREAGEVSALDLPPEVRDFRASLGRQR